MYFESLQRLGTVALFAVLGYVFLVLMIRLSGKRTLSNINIVDLIVTVAIGNVLAMTALSTNVSLAQGFVTMAVLIGVEFLSDWTATRWGLLRHLMYSQPVLIYYRGQFMRGPMSRERITEEDVRFAVRREGLNTLNEVEAVVLEIAGTLTVIHSSDHPSDILKDVEGVETISNKLKSISLKSRKL